MLNGDRPIIMTNGMSRPDSHLAIPIGPRKLFVAAPTLGIANSLCRQRADEVVKTVNDKIVRQARCFCIGVTDAHRPLFEKRFGERLPGSPFDAIRWPTSEELLKMERDGSEL
jgi:hypothetical protein